MVGVIGNKCFNSKLLVVKSGGGFSSQTADAYDLCSLVALVP